MDKDLSFRLANVKLNTEKLGRNRLLRHINWDSTQEMTPDEIAEIAAKLHELATEMESIHETILVRARQATAR